jgi:CRISPR-associated protein Cas1
MANVGFLARSAQDRATSYAPLPAHPRCDQPDFEMVEARQSTIKDAWRDYLRTASRPYSFETFYRHYFRWREMQLTAKLQTVSGLDALNPTGDEFVASEQYWRNRSVPKGKIVTLRNGASVRVANGSLELSERLPLHLAPDGLPSVTSFNEDEARRGRKSNSAFMMPKAIILSEHGWHVTAEAVKFCVEHNIALVSVSGRTSQGEKGLVSIVGGNPLGNATLLKAQVRANETIIAREIVRQKLETCASLGRFRPSEARAFLRKLDETRGLDQILLVEARAATAYWSNCQCDVRSTSRRWPAYWARFAVRNSAITGRAAQHADHPVNALLNWSYAVVAGRLSVELFARGAQLAIGYLHADKTGRYSLAYDALELLRPIIDEKVFSFVGKTRFRMGDFLVSPSGRHKGEVRVSQELLKVFAPAAFIANDEITRAADWMVEAIVGN